jgi:hypothetical protein
MAYTEQITFLLFLKMADEQTRPPWNRKPLVPPSLGWPSLLKLDGDDLPDPDVIAQEIADDLQAALDQFQAIAAELKK